MACGKTHFFLLVYAVRFVRNRKDTELLFTQMFAKVEQRDAVVQFHGHQGIDDRVRSS